MKKNRWPEAILIGGLLLLFSACNQNEGKTEAGNTAETEAHSGTGTAAEGTGNTKMMQLMHENMTAMQELKRNGDPDHDFALLMAKHHEGAIEMAEEEAEHGSDTMLVKMAKMTLTKQKEEQQVLQSFAENQREAPKDTANTKVLLQAMNGAMSNMDHNMQGSTDHHFARMMGIHHQSGIDMAKAYLPLAKVPEIRAMAEKIITDQQKEKQQLDGWLQKHQQ